MPDIYGIEVDQYQTYNMVFKSQWRYVIVDTLALNISELLLLVFTSTKNNGRENLFFLIFSTCLTEWPSLIKASKLSELRVE